MVRLVLLLKLLMLTGSCLATPYDREGAPLDPSVPPTFPLPHPFKWDPFANRANFEFVEYHYEQAHSSITGVNHLLDILAAQRILQGENSETGGFYDNYKELLAAIDAIKVGPTSWTSFIVRWNGPVDASSPSWKREEFVIHTRDIREAYHGMLSSRDFEGKFDTRSYKRWVKGERTYSNLMSSVWAWDKAVCFSLLSCSCPSPTFFTELSL